MRFLFVIAGLFVLVGCEQKSEPEQAKAVSLEPTVANIQSLIGESKASEVEACQLVKLGEKACGGPERYLVYSTETIEDEELLLNLVQEYNRLSNQRKQNQFSTCEFIPRPQVKLIDGVCKTE